MRCLLLFLIVSGGAQAAQASFTPTCTVTVKVERRPYVIPVLEHWMPGRLVSLTPSPSCPKNGVAAVRFRSNWSTQPDAPPGFFTLRPGAKITRRVPGDWWIEVRSKGLVWIRLEERN